MISAQILSRRLKICLTLSLLSLQVRLAAILLGIDLLFPPIISHAQTTNTRVLPGLANVLGANGTKFESTVWITNLGSAATSVELGLVPFGGVTAPTVQVRLISRGETLRFNNVLRDLFGLEETVGALTARASQPFDLRGVTANVSDPTGTFGVSVQSVAASALLRAGQAGHSIWLSHGTDLSRGFRTNVTVVLTEPNSSVAISLYDEVNTLRGVEIVSSPTPITWQASSSQLLSNPELPVGRVKFAVTAGAATAYTSVVDNITGDGIVVQAERSGSGTTDLLLNGVVRTPGANNSFFATDVRLFNPNESPLTVTIDALGFAGGTRTISRALAASGLVEILDVLGPKGFNFPEGSAGALRFRAASAFLVAGRTNNLDPSGMPGSFSTFQKAVPFGSGFITSANRGTLIGLNQNASVPGFRSNIAFFGGPDGAAGTLRLCDQLGLELASVPFTLDPQQWFQQPITGWFEGVEIPRDARVDVRLGSGSLDGYAAVVDNKTGDGVVVPLIVAAAEITLKEGAGFSNGRIFCAGDENSKRVIFSYASDGGDKKVIDFPAAYVGWSRDGSKAWVTSSDGKLWSMNPDGTGQKLVASLPGGGAGTPAPSPDGKLVAFTGFGINTDHPEIWVINSDGSNPHPLTKTTATSTTRNGQKIIWSVHPSWTPDGQKLSYASTQGGSSQIWVMNTDGSNAIQITTDNVTDSPDSNVPEYSLDGKDIVFWSGYETEYGDIWVMDADGTNRRRITDEPENVSADNPTWSPDGQWVIFISNRRGGTEPINAWLAGRSGGTPKLLSGNSGYCAWQPVR